MVNRSFWVGLGRRVAAPLPVCFMLWRQKVTSQLASLYWCGRLGVGVAFCRVGFSPRVGGWGYEGGTCGSLDIQTLQTPHYRLGWQCGALFHLHGLCCLTKAGLKACGSYWRGQRDMLVVGGVLLL